MWEQKGEPMLGQYLKKYRLDNNLTQEEMAKKLDTSQAYYCLLETGSKKPGIPMVNKIAKALDLEPSFIRRLL